MIRNGSLFRNSIFFLFLVTVSLQGYSQISSLQVICTVENNMQPITDADVVLYKNGAEVEKRVSDRKGEFRFDLDVNSEYMIHVKKEGFYGKKIAFNTEVPQEITGKWVMEFAMSLYQGCEGVDASALNDPVDRVKFSSNQGDFISDESYTTKMRGRIESLLMAIDQCQSDHYQQAMEEGNKLIQQGNYSEAMDRFEAALEIYPGDKSATRKYADAQRQAGASEQNEAMFEQALAEADQFFAEGNYTAARTKYNAALRVKPDSQVQSRISEIDQILQKQTAATQAQAQKDQEYSQLIAQANTAVSSKDYVTAKKFYDQAALVKPDATLPKQKSAEMVPLIAQQQQESTDRAAADKAYSEALAMGQNAMAQGDYATAKAQFQRAMGLRPDQSLARDKYREAQTQEESRNQAEANARKAQQLKQIETALDEGDALLANKDYEGAAAAYQKALQLDPNDSYAKKQVDKARSMQASASAARQKTLEKQYSDALDNGDNLVSANQYEQAIGVYKQALLQKPNDPVAQSKLAAAEQKLAMAQKQKAAEQTRQREYESLLAEAGNLYTQKNYEQAKAKYQSAAALFPEQSAPRSRMAEIDQLLAEKQKKEQLNDLAAKADQFLAAKNYVEARAAYQQLLAMDASHAVARQKIAELDRIEQDQRNQAEAKKQREAQYTRTLQEADNLMAMKRYEEAKLSYQKAMGYKPDDNYCIQQVAKVDALLAEQLRTENEKKALDQQYTQYISQADQALELGDYTKARAAYERALALKASETYPRQKMTEIDEKVRLREQAVAQQKALDAQYNQTVQQADDFMAVNQLEQAKSAYQKASALKPQEVYPKTQITRIDGLVAEQLHLANEQKALDQRYTAELERGDKAFGLNDWVTAKQAYQSALALKSGEAYPKAQVVKIDALLAQAEKEKQDKAAMELKYTQTVQRADQAFDKQEYDAAKAAYTEAQAMKPGESYPQERLQKIAQFERVLVARQKQIEQNTQSNTATAAKSKPASATKLASLKFANDSERDKYLNQLKSDYPVGVTMEVHTEKNSTTYRYVVIRGGEAREFRKVKFSWGGVEYSDNGIPTSGQYFESQVKSRDGETYQEFQY